MCAFVASLMAGAQDTNLALSGTASASFANGDAHLSNDGDTGTRWGSSGGADTEWYQIAWESDQTFNTVKILCEGAMNVSNAPILAFDIQVSNDGTNWTTKKHVWGKNGDNSQYITIVFNEPATAKYVRFQGVKKGTWGYSFWEFEVYNIDYSKKTLDSVTLSSYQNITSTNAGRTIALSVIGKTSDNEEIPTGSISWNNSSSTVGTVSGETFSALEQGTTTISATANGKTSAEITFTVTAPQVLGSIVLPYRIWSATQGMGDIAVSVLDTEGNPFDGDVTISWDGNAPVGAEISGKNITFGAASGAGAYTLKATSGSVEVTSQVYMVGTNPEIPTADDADVLAIYSGKYSKENYDGWNTGWEWGYGSRDIVAINNDNCVRIHNVGTYGFPYPAEEDLTKFTKLHFDVYTVDATSGKVRIEKTNIDNKAFTTTADAWTGIDIDLTGLEITEGNNWVDIYFGADINDKARDVLIDNVYFVKDIVPTTAISIFASSEEVTVDKTLQLTVKNQANNTIEANLVTFSSSNNAIATVNENGVVTGVAPGDVTITASLKDDASISNTIDITVNSRPEGMIVTSTDGNHTIIVQTFKYTGQSDYYEMIVLSDEVITDTHASYWTLSDKNAVVESTSISSDGHKLTISNISSTTDPKFYTPLYLNIAGVGEVTFKDGIENADLNWEIVVVGNIDEADTSGFGESGSIESGANAGKKLQYSWEFTQTGSGQVTVKFVCTNPEVFSGLVEGGLTNSTAGSVKTDYQEWTWYNQKRGKTITAECGWAFEGGTFTTPEVTYIVRDPLTITESAGVATVTGELRPANVGDINTLSATTCQVVLTGVTIKQPTTIATKNNLNTVYIVNDNQKTNLSGTKNLLVKKGDQYEGAITIVDQFNANYFATNLPIYATTASYTRAGVAADDYVTIALPFDADVPEGFSIYTAGEADSDNNVTFTKKESQTFEASQPYVIHNTNDENTDLVVNATVNAQLNFTETTQNAMHSVFSLMTTNSSTENMYVLWGEDESEKGKIVFHAAKGVSLGAFRAYFTGNAASPAPLLGMVDDNGTTGINSVERGALSVEGCYTLDGRRVAQPTKGLYIVNGKKVVIK